MQFTFKIKLHTPIILGSYDVINIKNIHKFPHFSHSLNFHLLNTTSKYKKIGFIHPHPILLPSTNLLSGTIPLPRYYPHPGDILFSGTILSGIRLPPPPSPSLVTSSSQVLSYSPRYHPSFRYHPPSRYHPLPYTILIPGTILLSCTIPLPGTTHPPLYHPHLRNHPPLMYHSPPRYQLPSLVPSSYQEPYSSQVPSSLPGTFLLPDTILFCNASIIFARNERTNQNVRFTSVENDAGPPPIMY